METSLGEFAPPQNERKHESMDREIDARKALLAGLIGGIVATAGYLLYQRLEEEQKENIRATVVSFVQDKISEIRSQIKM